MLLYLHIKTTMVSSAEIERIQKGEPKKEAETYLDLFSTKNVRVKERVLIPIKQYPRVSEALIFLSSRPKGFPLNSCVM